MHFSTLLITGTHFSFQGFWLHSGHRMDSAHLMSSYSIFWILIISQCVTSTTLLNSIQTLLWNQKYFLLSCLVILSTSLISLSKSLQHPCEITEYFYSIFAGGQLRHEEFGQQDALVLCPEFQKQRAWPLFIVFVFSCTYLKTSPITVSWCSEFSALLQIRLKVSEVSYSEMQSLSLGMTPWKAWARITEESAIKVGQGCRTAICQLP